MVLGLKPMGKPTTLRKNTMFWTELRSCMVLGFKLMRKLITFDNYLSVRQNQGLAWFSDSDLWGN